MFKKNGVLLLVVMLVSLLVVMPAFACVPQDPPKISVGSCYDPTTNEIVVKVYEKAGVDGFYRLNEYGGGDFVPSTPISAGEFQELRFDAELVDHQMTLRKFVSADNVKWHQKGGTHVLHTKEGFEGLYERGQLWALCPSETPVQGCTVTEQVWVWTIYNPDGTLAGELRDRGYDGSYSAPGLDMQRGYFGCDFYPGSVHGRYVDNCQVEYEFWDGLKPWCGFSSCE